MKIEWVAADWGTTNLRVWGMNQLGEEIAFARSGAGMNRLEPAEFEHSLIHLIENWLSADSIMDIVACGMVGARGGWMEAPYRVAPCTALCAKSSVMPTTKDDRMRVTILPGIMTRRPTTDVMRGEETILAGYLRQHEDFEGTICVPGTHTKWVHVVHGEVASFRTFMSGELYGLLTRHSVLSKSVNVDLWNENAFLAAVSAGLNKPEALTNRLFSVRAKSLVDGLDAASATSSISGLLIGSELSAARPYWLGNEIVVIGDGRFADAYRLALSAQGADCMSAGANDTVKIGLWSAWQLLGGSK